MNRRHDPIAGFPLLSYLFPYCIRRLSEGKYIFLNRHYRLVGSVSSDWVDYEACEEHHMYLNLTPARIQSLLGLDRHLNQGDTVYLYEGAWEPPAQDMKKYLSRLAKIMKWKEICSKT